MNKKRKGVLVFLQINILVVAVFAFCFFMNIEVVRGKGIKYFVKPNGDIIQYRYEGDDINDKILKNVYSDWDLSTWKVFNDKKRARGYSERIKNTLSLPPAAPMPTKLDESSDNQNTGLENTSDAWQVAKGKFKTPDRKVVEFVKTINTTDGTFFQDAAGNVYKSTVVDVGEKVTNPELLKKLGVKPIVKIPDSEKIPDSATNPKGLLFDPDTGSPFFNNILAGAQLAGALYGGVQLLGGWIGMNDNEKDAVSIAGAAGVMAAHLTQGISPSFAQTKSWWTLGMKASTFIGIGTAIIVFVLLYKKESKKIISFSCEPWQAPIGGDDCEKCNDGIHLCSEYRCKSLGQSCAIINEGTEEEMCYNQYRGDVNSPIITPWEDVLTKNHQYKEVDIRPPGLGMKIVKNVGECIQAFTPLRFGIQTNEPAQCKISWEHTLTFEEMTYFFGESNSFKYNHTQNLRLPSPTAVNKLSPEIQDDGTYTLYVRCMDPMGNYNEDEFAVRFCVEKGPDTTAPLIEGTSVGNRVPVSFNTSKLDIDVYVNEPSECRWSKEDRDYENMENQLTCVNSITEINAQMLYTCETRLTGIKDREENKYYFRCKDQPGAPESERNDNKQSFVLTVIGTQELNIINIKPNGTIKDSVTPKAVYLEVETAHGYNEGEATCYYSTTGDENNYISFLETNSYYHKQRQDLESGQYTYYVKCVDLGGNTDYNQTSFIVEIDNQAPIVTRVYQDEGKIKIITNENSKCSYSTDNCGFVFDEGISMPYVDTKEHFAEWDTNNNLYIKCQDNYGNKPSSNACSIIIRAYEQEEVDED